MGERTVAEALPVLREKVRAKGLAGAAAEAIVACIRRVEESPEDAQALSQLGNVVSMAGLPEAAMEWWEKAVRADRTQWRPWRNLGVAYLNVYGDIDAAMGAMERAIKAYPAGDHLLYERDQVWKRARVLPAERLREFEERAELVSSHTLLTLEYVMVLHQLQRYERARDVAAKSREEASRRAFWPLLVEWVRAQIGLGRRALWRGEAREACGILEAAAKAREEGDVPAELIARHAELHYWIGQARDAAGDGSGAQQSWATAAKSTGGSSAVRIYFAAMALRKLGKGPEAERLFEKLAAREIGVRRAAPAPPVEAGLPQLREDPAAVEREKTLAEALGRFGLGEKKAARQLLGDVLRDDPNCGAAADLMLCLDWDV